MVEALITRQWWENRVLYWLVLFPLLEVPLLVIMWVQPFEWLMANRKRLGVFAVVGGVTVPIGLLALWALTEIADVPYYYSNVLAILASSLAWLMLHSLVTFRDRDRSLEVVMKGLGVRALAVLWNTTLLCLLVEYGGLWYLWAACVSMVLHVPLAYVLANRCAWGRERAPAIF